MLIRGVIKFSARNCPGINFKKVGNYATHRSKAAIRLNVYTTYSVGTIAGIWDLN